MADKKNLDELNDVSREFYERALFKMSLSLVFAAAGLFFLGLSCAAGGQSAAYNNFGSANYMYDKDANTDLEGGYGFACFAYLLGFIVSSAASIYLSPLLAGSKMESKILQTPNDIDAPANPTTTIPVAEPVYSDPQASVNKV